MDPDSWYKDLEKEPAKQKPPPRYSDISLTQDPDYNKENAEYEAIRRPPPRGADRPASSGAKPGPDSPKAAGDQTWKSLMFNYSQDTSLHGVRYITGASRFVIRRVLWLLVFGSAFGFFVYYTYNRVDYFLQYNKNVNVEVNYLQKVKFPAVTFCNQNSFRITAVADNGWYHMVKSLFSSSETNANRPCYEDEFQCVTDKSCIAIAKRCDVFPDCMDASDEANCDLCPLLYFDGPSSYQAALPEVVGRHFELQPKTWNSSTPVYMSASEPYVYLYEQSGKWWFGEGYQSGQQLAYYADSALHPQDINATASNWTLYMGAVWTEAEDLTVSCAGAYSELLVEGDSAIIPGLSLEELYLKASHNQSVFIQNCKWKGLPCEEGSIQTSLTDMGVCFTYNSSDMFIEQAGPGYGLTLTANIEQYEYTKSTEEGLGIKLLMHDPGDVAMMKEQGVSVSPGLYSFISVETTQVQNLEPDYGNCGSQELKYYPGYTISRCVMSCETVELDKECGCRDLNMPDTNGLPAVCDVAEYVNCANPRIEEMRASGNFCKSCPTPCLQDKYVPTTSFSVVLGPESSTNAQDEASVVLRQKLVRARETTYRVVKSKYLQTMRNFHILDQQMSTTLKFLEAIKVDLAAEHVIALEHVHQVQADCTWTRGMLEDAKDRIQSYVIEPVRAFRSVFQPRGYTAVNEVKDLVSDAISTVAFANANHNGSAAWDEYFLYYVSRRNDTVWQTYSSLTAALEQLMSDQGDLRNTVDGMPQLPYLRLKDTLINPLLYAIGDHCSWCVVAAGTPLTQIAESRALSDIGNNLLNDLTYIKNKMNGAYFPYLVDLWIANVSLTVSGSDRSKYNYKINNATNRMTTALNRLDGALDDALDEVKMIDDLLRYAWNLKCQTELPKMLLEYEGSHEVLVNLLDEMDHNIRSNNDNLEFYKESYTNDTMLLETVAGKIQFAAMKSVILGKRVRIDTILENRWLLLGDIQAQINQIYYVIMGVIKDSHTAATSDYWQEFGITSPSTQTPTLSTLSGVTIPLADFGMVPNTAAADHWQALEDRLNSIKDNAQLQVDDLIAVIDEAKTFFDAYREGNQLNADFYSKNFLQVELFYKELTERKVTQQEAYTTANLLSELGGFMGLLLGASVLSVFEILDVFVYNGFRKCVRSKVKPEDNKARRKSETPRAWP